jgi:hypothetical protein
MQNQPQVSAVRLPAVSNYRGHVPKCLSAINQKTNISETHANEITDIASAGSYRRSNHGGGNESTRSRLGFVDPKRNAATRFCSCKGRKHVSPYQSLDRTFAWTLPISTYSAAKPAPYSLSTYATPSRNRNSRLPSGRHVQIQGRPQRRCRRRGHLSFHVR